MTLDDDKPHTALSPNPLADAAAQFSRFPA